MPLNYVDLIGNIPGGAGCTINFVASNWLADTTDHQMIPPVPDPIVADKNGAFSVELLATDNAVTPSGWYWTITISGIAGVTFSTWSFFLLYSGGATQYLDELVELTSPAAAVGSLPVPTGSPGPRTVPFATGSGQASEWLPMPLITVSPIAPQNPEPGDIWIEVT